MARRPKLTGDEIDQVFLDYCANMTHKQICDKWSISDSTLTKLINTQGWAEKRKATKQLALDKCQAVYVDANKELVDRYYQAGYKLLCLWEASMKDNSSSILDKEGKISHFKLAQAIQNMVAIKTFLDECTGTIPFKEAMELKMKYEQMELKKAIAGLGGDETVQDNFMDILAQSFAKLSEGDNNGEV